MCFVLEMLTSEFFTRHPLACAIELVGCELVWGHCRGVVVETEGYTALGDEACHTFLRRGAQRFVDDHPAGTAYIYLNYGIHWLLNVLVKHRATDGFVLVRAVEPTAGLPLMQERRKLTDPLKLCSGPGKLTQAFGIPATFHGSSLCHDETRAFQAAAPGPARGRDRLRRADRHLARGGFAVAVPGGGQRLRQPQTHGGGRQSGVSRRSPGAVLRRDVENVSRQP